MGGALGAEKTRTFRTFAKLRFEDVSVVLFLCFVSFFFFFGVFDVFLVS